MAPPPPPEGPLSPRILAALGLAAACVGGDGKSDTSGTPCLNYTTDTETDTTYGPCLDYVAHTGTETDTDTDADTDSDTDTDTDTDVTPCLDYAPHTGDSGTYGPCLDYYTPPTGDTGGSTSTTPQVSESPPAAPTFERLAAEGILPADVVERLRTKR